ncbi:hypothetical protein cypCar_00007266 [Cyprinus carpio]|nr:hypothetical protein cypCar_00007266 [Cyprinus carpio]
MDQAVNSDPVNAADSGRQRWRNWIGFWLLGLCNNFAYVVMLSAAHDILQKQESHNTTTPTPAPNGTNTEISKSSRYDCSPVSTAAVLLADILPTLLIKFTAPFYIHRVPYGFRVLVCFFTAVVSFLMVSFSSTILMSIFGTEHVSSLPVLVQDWGSFPFSPSLCFSAEDKHIRPLSFTDKIYIMKVRPTLYLYTGLLKFIIPLGVVYFAEYFINQGLCLNAVLLAFAVYYQFLPNPWVVFIIVLYEGLLGGAAYVNTFFFIREETAKREREFAMAAASVGDSLGIALSAAAAFPVHHYFCSL